MPPNMAARKIFEGLDVRKKPTANGVVNPNENNIPAKKDPKYPRESILFIWEKAWLENKR